MMNRSTLSCMRKYIPSQQAALTFGVLVPVGILGAIFCVLLLAITAVFQLLSFVFLLITGLSTLLYGYLSQSFDHLFHHHQHA
jgi:hypothetical protein